jgi:AcrR family transcriptional regulator
VIDAALELFELNGYDETTTVDIAEAAGVSPRTFFRYFPTKESLLFFGRFDFVRSFNGVFLAQPGASSDLDAMVTAFVLLAPEIERLRRRIASYQKIVMSSMALRGREQEELDQNVDMLAEAISERRGLTRADDSCRLLARVGLLVLEHAMMAWMAAAPRARLASSITDSFGRLADVARPRPGRRKESP